MNSTNYYHSALSRLSLLHFRHTVRSETASVGQWQSVFLAHPFYALGQVLDDFPISLQIESFILSQFHGEKPENQLQCKVCNLEFQQQKFKMCYI